MADEREKELCAVKHKSRAVIPFAFASLVHARSVCHHEVFHQSSVAAFCCFNNVGFACNASSSSSSLQQCASRRRQRVGRAAFGGAATFCCAVVCAPTLLRYAATSDELRPMATSRGVRSRLQRRAWVCEEQKASVHGDGNYRTCLLQ